jgi:hypothetical protein
MNAHATIPAEPVDDILTLAPDCQPDGEEYQLRARLRGQRNAMSAMICRTPSDTARALAWLVVEYASAHVYAATSLDRLREIGRFCHRLCLTALQAEDVDI